MANDKNFSGRLVLIGNDNKVKENFTYDQAEAQGIKAYSLTPDDIHAYGDGVSYYKTHDGGYTTDPDEAFSLNFSNGKVQINASKSIRESDWYKKNFSENDQFKNLAKAYKDNPTGSYVTGEVDKDGNQKTETFVSALEKFQEAFNETAKQYVDNVLSIKKQVEKNTNSGIKLSDDDVSILATSLSRELDKNSSSKVQFLPQIVSSYIDLSAFDSWNEDTRTLSAQEFYEKFYDNDDTTGIRAGQDKSEILLKIKDAVTQQLSQYTSWAGDENGEGGDEELSVPSDYARTVSYLRTIGNDNPDANVFTGTKLFFLSAANSFTHNITSAALNIYNFIDDTANNLAEFGSSTGLSGAVAPFVAAGRGVELAASMEYQLGNALIGRQVDYISDSEKEAFDQIAALGMAFTDMAGFTNTGEFKDYLKSMTGYTGQELIDEGIKVIDDIDKENNQNLTYLASSATAGMIVGGLFAELVKQAAVTNRLGEATKLAVDSGTMKTGMKLFASSMDGGTMAAVLESAAIIAGGASNLLIQGLADTIMTDSELLNKAINDPNTGDAAFGAYLENVWYNTIGEFTGFATTDVWGTVARTRLGISTQRAVSNLQAKKLNFLANMAEVAPRSQRESGLIRMLFAKDEAKILEYKISALHSEDIVKTIDASRAAGKSTKEVFEDMTKAKLRKINFETGARNFGRMDVEKLREIMNDPTIIKPFSDVDVAAKNVMNIEINMGRKIPVGGYMSQEAADYIVARNFYEIWNDTAKGKTEYARSLEEVKSVIDSFELSATPELKNAIENLIEMDKNYWPAAEDLKVDLDMRDEKELASFRNSKRFGENGHNWYRTIAIKDGEDIPGAVQRLITSTDNIGYKVKAERDIMNIQGGKQYKGFHGHYLDPINTILADQAQMAYYLNAKEFRDALVKSDINAVEVTKDGVFLKRKDLKSAMDAYNALQGKVFKNLFSSDQMKAYDFVGSFNKTKAAGSVDIAKEQAKIDKKTERLLREPTPKEKRTFLSRVSNEDINRLYASRTASGYNPVVYTSKASDVLFKSRVDTGDYSLRTSEWYNNYLGNKAKVSYEPQADVLVSGYNTNMLPEVPNKFATNEEFTAWFDTLSDTERNIVEKTVGQKLRFSEPDILGGKSIEDLKPTPVTTAKDVRHAGSLVKQEQKNLDKSFKELEKEVNNIVRRDSLGGLNGGPDDIFGSAVKNFIDDEGIAGLDAKYSPETFNSKIDKFSKKFGVTKEQATEIFNYANTISFAKTKDTAKIGKKIKEIVSKSNGTKYAPNSLVENGYLSLDAKTGKYSITDKGKTKEGIDAIENYFKNSKSAESSNIEFSSYKDDLDVLAKREADYNRLSSEFESSKAPSGVDISEELSDMVDEINITYLNNIKASEYLNNPELRALVNDGIIKNGQISGDGISVKDLNRVIDALDSGRIKFSNKVNANAFSELREDLSAIDMASKSKKKAPAKDKVYYVDDAYKLYNKFSLDSDMLSKIKRNRLLSDKTSLKDDTIIKETRDYINRGTRKGYREFQKKLQSIKTARNELKTNIEEKELIESGTSSTEQTVISFIDDFKDSIIAESNNSVVAKQYKNKLISNGVPEDIVDEYYALSAIRKMVDTKEFSESLYEHMAHPKKSGSKAGINLQELPNVQKELKKLIKENVDAQWREIVGDASKNGFGDILDQEAVYKETIENMKKFSDDVESNAVVRTVDENGEYHYMRISPMLSDYFNALQSIHGSNSRAISKIFGKANRMFRFGTTGLSISSFINQMVRDPINAWIMGGIRRGIRQCEDEISEILGTNTTGELIDKLGKSMYDKAFNLAKQSGIAEPTTRDVAKEAASIMRSETESIYGTPKLLAKDSKLGMENQYWQDVRYGKESFSFENVTDEQLKNLSKVQKDDLMSRIEKILPNNAREIYLRNLVYMNNLNKSLKNGLTLDEAKAMARFTADNATTDFSRTFAWGNEFIRCVPYLGAALNGSASFWRLLEMDPVGVMGRLMGGLGFTTMSLTAQSMQGENYEVYKNIPEYYKKDNLVFVVNGQPFKLPIPQELSAFIAPWRQSVEAMYSNGKTDFAWCLMNDLLSVPAIDLDGFTDLDWESIQGDNAFMNMLNGEAAKIVSQFAPEPIKVAYILATGIDPYTGKEIDNSWVYYDDEGNQIVTDYTQNRIAEWVSSWFGQNSATGKSNKLWGTTMSPSSAYAILKNLFGTGVTNIAGAVAEMLPNGRGIEGMTSTLMSDFTKPFNITKMNLAHSEFRADINRLEDEKNLILAADGSYQALYKELSKAYNTGDMTKVTNIRAKLRQVTQDFDNKVKAVVDKYVSAGGRYGVSEVASVISLMTFNTETGGLSNASLENSKQVYYDTNREAKERMVSLGFTSPNDNSIFGYMTTDKYGNTEMKMTSPTAILNASNLGYSAKDESMALLTNVIEKQASINGKTIKETYYEKIKPQVDEIYAKGKLSNADYNKISDIYKNWDVQVMEAVMPVLNTNDLNNLVEDYDVVDYLGQYIKVPSDYEKTNKGRNIPSSSRLNKQRGFIKSYVKYIYDALNKEAK